jgi:hypothetical protein
VALLRSGRGVARKADPPQCARPGISFEALLWLLVLLLLDEAQTAKEVASLEVMCANG